ncbi:hypothetical protein NPX13_g11053 [Xylaria arbuscula]|uniref:Thioester reductase (TE) domain-containing protein n=1 Tax=Xylaria arbuscula TaxID=114810 RepID=A0A9W8N3J9_9PEZI|nr:hypothetical protein NPX13_g11053 [Xylaria arbuscula]
MSSPTSSPRVLLTGATGFIGGSVLTQLLDSTSPSLRSAPITCLIRGADRAAKLKATYGERVNPVLYSKIHFLPSFPSIEFFDEYAHLSHNIRVSGTLSVANSEDKRNQDLDDVETATALAAQHDVVISTTIGYHIASARALQEGLAQRKRTHPGSEPWFIHTSGTSNVGSRPVSGAWLDDESPGGGTFDDVADDVYGYEAKRNAKQPYIQRTTELAVVDAGLELDVRTQRTSQSQVPQTVGSLSLF